MTAIRFREATAADAVAIAELLTASWQDAYAGLLPEALLRDDLPMLHRAAWEAHFAAPRPGAVLLAEAPDGLHGFCACWRQGDEAYVDNLHLRPGLRGGGLGRALLGRAVDAVGAPRAALTIIEGNDGALRFYRRLGGIDAAPYPAEVHGAAIRMRRIAWDDSRLLVAACGVGAG